MRKKITFNDLIAEIEFYIECPECDAEIIITDIFRSIRCPKCGHTFKPHQLKTRKKSHTNPSFRGFSAGVKVDGKEKYY